MEAVKRIAWRSVPVLRIFLGVLFIYAGVGKLLEVGTFALQLQRFGLENPLIASAAAHYLPFLEIASGFGLVFRRMISGAICISTGLLLVFEIALALAWISGVQADCGCFGRLFGGASIPAAFIRNLGLLAIAFLLLRMEWGSARRKIQ